MNAIIDRLKIQLAENVGPVSQWLPLLEEVRVYSEGLEQELVAIRENREILLTIINLIPVAFFVKDHESNFFLMNRACEEQWGLSFSAIRDTDGRQFFPADQMKQFLAKDRSIFENGKPVEFEETFWSVAKQSNRIGYTFKRPIYDIDGNPQYLVCVTLDITDRKAAQAALVESERKLLVLATTDPLTDLPNRRKMLACLTDEFARSRRFSELSSSVIMIDLDHFKNVNDKYGHGVGDAVLKHFAVILRANLRTVDTAGRMGGEEFAVVLPGADVVGAKVFAERLQKFVARTPWVQAEMPVPITISIGIAVFDPRDVNSDDALIRADKALYRAKKYGRNRVEIAGNGERAA